MEKVIDLKDLLKHEITDLYSAEEQIIEALPLMIEKAVNGKLKAALEDHLKVTENQKSRLDDIKQLLAEEASGGNEGESEKPGFFSRLFGDSEEKCKGMEGLISEGKKVMATDMSPEAADAAIIASAQKIEHYEISGYGTARAFARELNLGEVAAKLEETLNEEYAADNLLTDLAVGKINVEAEFANGSENGVTPSKRTRPRPVSKPTAKSIAKAPLKNAGVKKINKASAGKKSTVKLSAGKNKAAKPALKSSAVKSRIAPAKGKSFRVSPAVKTPVKLKKAVKKIASKSSKAGNSKSPLKNKSSRKR